VDAVCRLLDGILTRGGHARRTRLESCGVAYPVLVGDEDVIAWERRGCGDRFCPDCAAALSRERAQLVRDFWEARARGRGRRGAFITLTQPRLPGEAARTAVRRALTTWRTISNGRTGLCDGLLRTRRKHGGVILPGGLRSLELTARAAGTQIGEYTVRSSGVHAHFHILAELGEGVTMATVARRLIGAWTEVSGGSPGAQDVQVLKHENVYQALKYAVDLGSLARLVDVAPGYARAVVLGLHGVRTCEPWGTWRGSLRKPPGRCRFGDRSIASLVMSCDGDVCFGRRREPATQVLAAVATGQRYGELRRAEIGVALDRIRLDQAERGE